MAVSYIVENPAGTHRSVLLLLVVITLIIAREFVARRQSILPISIYLPLDSLLLGLVHHVRVVVTHSCSCFALVACP